MLHRPDLTGSDPGSPIMDDFYFYMAVGDLALAKDFFADKLVPTQKQEQEQNDA